MLGMMPSQTHMPQLPIFTPTSTAASRLDLLAATAMSIPQAQGSQQVWTQVQITGSQQVPAALPPDLHRAGPYNPAVPLPPRVVKRILALEFVKMAELADIWSDDAIPQEGPSQPRQ